ncbi:uncharacterized protein LOC114240742 [Bombyx mandarina]|uniref:Uncharacterized protein LOC114240742 n=1 Tax=Bombyx mandarina TaxID=7092 RepID=A0A6J2JD23_BOMMA|nr:uncharacterized protein LOC114240742 [Bombyx mandarina]
MKLPFNIVLTPILKPYLGNIKSYCQQYTFVISYYYTCFYGTVGLFISIHHLKTHLGEQPMASTENIYNFMIIHDLKIIATSMGFIQYVCLLIGCLTENPALFLPHLFGQLVVIFIKIVNAFFSLTRTNSKSLRGLLHKALSILIMTFNWMQEFCVFRLFLCVCDL